MKYNYQNICANLLKDLSQRTVAVLERRFGLKGNDQETLEAIGETYGLTRERVRQIEQAGLGEIKPKLKDFQKVFSSFKDALKSSGNLKKEEALLDFLAPEKYRNYVLFLLNLNDEFSRCGEDKDFYPFWTIEKNSIKRLKKVIKLTINKLQKIKSPVSLDNLFTNQKKELIGILNKKVNKDIFYSYIQVSKEIQRNPEGQFGLKNWLEINPRGIKDKAYLVLRKQGNPLHFAQVATLIEKSPFSSLKKAHTATVHNELIKDPRFVLVGRGLYALKEWGYIPGMVKDVISKVLKDSESPLSREEVIKRVLEQRFVKKNTVLLSLQDSDWFIKDEEGRYKVREA